MSREIDEKVVEMRFDNRQFESNVSTSISSLEKLKKSLDFKGASKGLEGLERSAKSVDMGPIGRSVDVIKGKFSALETIGVGALLRIGSQAAITGERILKSLTVDPVKTGFDEYELKMGSIQTIMASTGESLDRVNQKLNELNEYSDQTIYSFSDMTTNIGKFTNAGVKLDDAVAAIKGVSNVAAVSGATANEASRAMYNFAQALSAGYVKLIDWKSIENANMATVEFKTQLMESAVAAGTLTRSANGMYKTLAKGTVIDATHLFNDSLQEQWMTTEVLVSTLNKYADATTEIGKKATAAAQDVKTWTMLMDTLRESAQSGWAETWQLIVGDFEESKRFFTRLSEDIGGMLTDSAKRRNEVLAEGLNSTYDQFRQNIGTLEKELEGLSEAELAAKGYTKEQADAIRDLNRKIEEGNPELKEYVESLSTRPSGRENLAQTIFNIKDALFLMDEETGKAIGFLAVLRQAWSEAFPPLTGEKIYEVTKKLRDLTERLIPSQETADKLRITFKGLFSILDIGAQAITAILRTVSPLAGKLLGVNTGVLDLTSTVGGWITGLDNAIREHDVFFRSLERITNLLGYVANAFRDFTSSVQQEFRIPSFDELISSIRTLSDIVRGRFDEEGQERIRSFIKRLKELDGISLENIRKALADFRDNVLGYFFDFGSVFDELNDQAEGFGSNVGGALSEITGYAEDAKTKAVRTMGAFIEAFGKMRDRMFEIALDIRNAISDRIGFAEIFAVGIGTAMVVFTKKIADAMAIIAAPLDGIGSVLGSASKALKAFALKVKSEALKNVAQSVLMLAGALAVLSLLDQEKLKSSAVILGLLVAGLLAFSFAMSKIGKPTEIAGSSASILAIGASLMMMAAGMKKLEGLENIGKSFGVLTGMMAELLIMVKLVSSDKKTYSVGMLSLIGLALSLKVLMGAIKDIDRMKINNVERTVGLLAAAVAGIAVIGTVSKGMSFGSGAGLLAMIAALNLFVDAFKSLARVDLGQTRAALQSFVVVFGMFTSVMAASRFAGKYASEAGSAILKMSAALSLVVLSFKMMERINPLILERTKKVVTELFAVFAIVTAASHFSGENANKAGTMLLAMSGAIMILTGAIGMVALLAKYNPEGLKRGLDAVEQLLILFGAMTALTRFAGKADEITKPLVVLTVAVSVMTAAIAAMSMLDEDRLKGAVTALGVMMTAFSLMVASTHLAGKAAGTLAVLTGVVLGLSVILYGMGQLDVKNAVANAEGLSMLMGALSVSLLALSQLGVIAHGALGAVGIMTAVTAGMAIILGVMQHYNVQPAIETAGSLSILLLSLSGACLLLAGVGTVGTPAFLGLGVLGSLVLGLGGIMAGIAKLTENYPTVGEDLDRAIVILEKIGTGLGAVIGGIIGGIAGGMSSGLPLIGTNLSNFMTNAQPFLSGVRNIDPTVVSGMKNLTEALAFIAGAKLLEAVSSVLTGGYSLPAFAANLVPFGESIAAFSKAVSGIDTDSVTAAATAGKMLGEMSATIPNTGGIISFFAGENDILAFSDRLIPFAKGMTAFSKEVKNIDSDAVINAATAGEALAQMAATVPNSGGVIGWFAGENDIDAFAARLIPFGAAMKEFSLVVTGLDAEAVAAAAVAGKMVTELANTVPNSGGALGFLAGENDIDTFGVRLVAFGKYIRAFSDEVRGLDASAVRKAASAGKVMVELAATIPNTGGVISFFSGDNDIEAFGSGLESFGDALILFSSRNISADAVQNAVMAGEVLIQLSELIPKSGGVLSFFTGNSNFTDFGEGLESFGEALIIFSDNRISLSAVKSAVHAGKELLDLGKKIPTSTATGSMAVFAEELVPFGRAMSDFSVAVNGLTPKTVESAVNAGKIITGLTKTIPNSGGLAGLLVGNNNMAAFAEQLVPFGKSIREFSDAVSGITPEMAEGAINAGKALTELAAMVPNSGGIAGFLAGNNDLDTFGTKLYSFGVHLQDYYMHVSTIDPDKLGRITTQIKGLIDLANDAGAMNQSFFTEYGEAFRSLANIGVDAFASTFENSSERVNSAVSVMVGGVSDSLSKNKELAKPGMQDVMDTLSGAIAQKSDKVNGSVITIMSGLTDTLRGYQNEFYYIGQYHVQGFINGVNSKKNDVVSAGTALGNAIANATRDTLGIHSPGDEGYAEGSYHVQGLVNGAKDSLKNVADTGKKIGGALMNGTTSGLSEGVGKIKDVITGALNKAGADTSSIDFSLFDWGKNADGANSEAAAVDAVANAYDNAAAAKNGYAKASAKNKIYYGGYESEEYRYLTEHMGEGLAIGFQNGIVSAENAVSESVGEVVRIAGAGLDTWKDWLSEKKYYSKISLKEELTGWEKLQSAYVVGTKERQEIDRELYRVQNELVNSTYQFSMDWIEREKTYNRLSTEEELAAYERMQKRYKEGSQERMELDKKVYALRNQLVNESYENSMNWIEEEKYYGRLTLSDELAAYKRVQSRYAKGTEERKKMDREVYRLEQEIYEAQKQYVEDVQRVQSEANDQRVALEEERAERIRSINEQLSRDIESENNRYMSALESRTDALYNSYGLFDAVKEREEVSGDTLMQNLEDQVKEFRDWQDALDSLSAKGMDSELIDELQKMGPSSISQIKALESMTGTELDKYVALWQVKHGQARLRAVSELEGLRTETLNNISQLRIDADDELEEYQNNWQLRLAQVNANAETQLSELRQEFAEKVGLIRRDTEAETQEMVDNVRRILEAAGWNETGRQIVTGLKNGIESEKPSFLDALTQMALDGVEAVKDTLDIHSPSRVFEQLGGFTGMGFVKGLSDYADKSYAAGAAIAETAKGGLSDAMQTINAYLNGDLEEQPVIRPVLDLSGVANDAAMIDGMFGNPQLSAFAGRVSSAFSANMGERQMTVHVNNGDVVQELRSLRGEMTDMTERIMRMQIVLDSGTMVGELADQMDEALGQRAAYRRRRN